MKKYAIILAGGAGERSGLEIPKQFVKIAGKPVIIHTLEIFQRNKNIDEIIIVTHPNYIDSVKDLVKKFYCNKVTKIIAGGNSRRESSFIGLNSIEDGNAKVLIHDAVRPFISQKIINDCIKALDKYKAVDVAISSADTIIKVNSENIIEDIPQRNFLRRGQTPQAFDLKTIKLAHKIAEDSGNITVTDDCGLILKFKLCDIYVVKGDDSNIKITYPIDLDIADKLFQLKNAEIDNVNLKDLGNKIIVVYGGSGGIGKSVCEIAKRNNAKVYSFSRIRGVDISDYQSIIKSLDEVYTKEKRIDFIINTAGILHYGEINNRTEADIAQEIGTNYLGCINIAKASFKYLKESKGELLLYSSSSYTRGRKFYSIYSSSKAAVVNFTQALAEEWEEYGIGVNVIVPERTATPMRYENFGEEPKDTLLTPEYVAQISLNTVLTGITGQIINIRAIHSSEE